MRSPLLPLLAVLLLSPLASSFAARPPPLPVLSPRPRASPAHPLHLALPRAPTSLPSLSLLRGGSALPAVPAPAALLPGLWASYLACLGSSPVLTKTATSLFLFTLCEQAPPATPPRIPAPSI